MYTVKALINLKVITMVQPKKSVNVRIKIIGSNREGVRCAFPHFFEPWTNKPEDMGTSKAKYQCLIALDKEYDTESIQTVEDGVRKVVAQYWGEKDLKRIGKSIDSPLVDGENKSDKYEVLENYFTLSAKKTWLTKKGKELPPPKMMAVVNGRNFTADHKDWSEDMMMTGRYIFIVNLYTSPQVNDQGDKVCVGLESILALPALESDEEEIMPGFGGVQSAVEDDFADDLNDLGIEAAIPSSAAEFEDDESTEDTAEDLDDLDDELDEEPEEESEPEPVAEEKPKRRARSSRTRSRGSSDTGETESADGSPRKTKRARSPRTRTRR
ncbi:Protein of unknown function (DUF2815) [Leptolyngbya sp. PCC 7375]|nr:Protein of unknown function (DUF2815) [Leptolyngbya sp. PCC 7375]